MFGAHATAVLYGMRRGLKGVRLARLDAAVIPSLSRMDDADSNTAHMAVGFRVRGVFVMTVPEYKYGDLLDRMKSLLHVLTVRTVFQAGCHSAWSVLSCPLQIPGCRMYTRGASSSLVSC